MIINISDLLRKNVIQKDISLELELTSFRDSYETYKVIKPLKVEGKMDTTSNDMVSFDGCIKGEIELTCSRCLKKFAHELNIEFHEKLTNNPENKDDEVIFIDNDNFDLTEIVENNVIVSLPIKRLCKPDCKGLCPTCGADLNHETCKCEDQKIDPRFEELKKLFSNK
ncbi:MAG: DUF177 domain-containing protein [Clostridium sp.]|nr:DUF177 domain-containing protein [Clostridium sp.]